MTTVWWAATTSARWATANTVARPPLPIWIDYMRTALKDTPIAQNEPPSGMVQATLNGATEWVKVEDMDRLTDYDLNLNTPQADAAAFDIFEEGLVPTVGWHCPCRAEPMLGPCAEVKQPSMGSALQDQRHPCSGRCQPWLVSQSRAMLGSGRPR